LKNTTVKIFTRTNGMSNEGRSKRLKEIYEEIETLNPEILPDLNKMIRLYSQAQMLIGYMDADALYQSGRLYAERKRLYAETIQSESGTVAEKESAAELAIYELRLQEEKAKAESRKWNNLFKSTDNLIIALRRDERTALEEYRKANDLNA